jgi:hypothetical protein
MRASTVQPSPEDYDFELDEALASIVGIRTIIPGDAFTAESLGTERAGNGVVIRGDGLVLTIGYLITEAETVWISSGGNVVSGHVLGYDQETGLGLVQALGRLDLPPCRSARQLRKSASRWWSPAPADGRRGSAHASPSRSSPATGSTCWTRRSLPHPPIPTGAAPR